jgi:asparagine synthase (glutamine-hydrolysing)
MGFGVPIGAWLRGPLREWADDLLSPATLATQGLLRAEPVRDVWHQHLAGQGDFAHELWTVLMLNQWLSDDVRAAQRLA